MGMEFEPPITYPDTVYWVLQQAGMHLNRYVGSPMVSDPDLSHNQNYSETQHALHLFYNEHLPSTGIQLQASDTRLGLSM